MLRLSASLTLPCLGVLLSLAPAAADEEAPVKVTPLPFNTSADEDDPHLADAMLTLFFTSSEKGKEELKFVTRRNPRQNWPTKPTDVDDYVQNKGDIRGAFATQGRYPRYLYFAAKDKEGKNYDLFVAVKHDPDKVWAAPTPVGKVNTEEDECFPWVTSDGKALYFSRKTSEGWRLLTAKRARAAGPQGWGEPEPVGLPADFHHATLTPDGKTMILQGRLGKGRWGLFRSNRAGKGWSKPEAIAGLNHPEGKVGDRSPNLSRDGSLLYFASDRPGGKGGFDVYVCRMADLKKR